MSPLFKVNYCLIYGTSETYRSVHICVDKVNYYLDYRTSETSGGYRFRFQEVNYYLDYRTSETILQTAQTKGG